MDSIILKGRDYDNLQEVDSRSQSQTQYNNFRVVLYRVTKGFQDVSDKNMIIVEEDAENREYLLDALERYQWGIDDPANDVVSADFTRPCRIVVKGCYYGYTPYDYATDERGETLIFDHAAAAQAWIDEQEAGRYYLGHNEAGRPTFYIVAA